MELWWVPTSQSHQIQTVSQHGKTTCLTMAVVSSLHGGPVPPQPTINDFGDSLASMGRYDDEGGSRIELIVVFWAPEVVACWWEAAWCHLIFRLESELLEPPLAGTPLIVCPVRGSKGALGRVFLQTCHQTFHGGCVCLWFGFEK